MTSLTAIFFNQPTTHVWKALLVIFRYQQAGTNHGSTDS